MSDNYSLTVVNQSEIDRPTFAVFATLPVNATYDSIALAWLTQPINQGNTYTFTWPINWGFAWSATGTAADYQWTGSGTIAADPDSPSECQVSFDYNGDFEFSYVTRANPDGGTLWITDTSKIPEPDTQASSVAVTLGGDPACAVNAGPNLSQTFTLHPTYYIDAGTYVQGQMVDGASVTNFQELVYAEGNQALTAVLSADNTWSVQPTSEVNIAKLLAK